MPFRDKERMKQVARRGRPAHAAALPRRAPPTACARPPSAIGFPVIVKPIAGAGSADTYRVDDAGDARGGAARPRGTSPEVTVEEFIEGEEYTFDTICADGRILYYNVAWYRPKPLIGRTVEWISPQTVTLRDVDHPSSRPASSSGCGVLRALGFRTGFTHMEWFRKPDGEAVFGEIAARPPGRALHRPDELRLRHRRLPRLGRGRLPRSLVAARRAALQRRRHLQARAGRRGASSASRGSRRLLARYGDAIVCVDLLPLGAPRRNWKQTLLSDGYLIVRHPDLGDMPGDGRPRRHGPAAARRLTGRAHPP